MIRPPGMYAVVDGAEVRVESYAWLVGSRGPRGEALSLLVTARTPPRGWHPPGSGQKVDVWAWPVSEGEDRAWSVALAGGGTPAWRDPGTPQQWLQVRGDDTRPVQEDGPRADG